MTNYVARALLFVLFAAVSAKGQPSTPPLPVDKLEASRRTAAAELAAAERRFLHFAGDERQLDEAAEIAWRYVTRNAVASTGLIAAVPNYPYSTVWDLASSLAAVYCGAELQLIGRQDADQWLERALDSMALYTLYKGAAYNKLYSVTTGAMVDRSGRPSAAGYGWSTTDIGRLLIWLRIIAESRPALANKAQTVATRLRFDRLIDRGYLWGEDLDARGVARRYQEGHLGYEQYSARGFALWGHRADLALDFDANALPIEVMGQRVTADLRQRDRLTSDPFVLSGIELGWEPREARLARAVLATQEERFKRTGIVTIVGEDALREPPHFFYYYAVFTNNLAFGVDVQAPNAVVDGPRWVSTKSAFGWHALAPSAYTRRAVDTVQPAAGPDGWASGVYERGGSTHVPNINTAAVVLEAALFERRGQPLLKERP